MEYRRFGDAYYIRMDAGDEVMSCIKDVCAREGVRSATFSGIGGCGSAEIQVFDPEAGAFSTERFEGLLELVSVMGNAISDEDGGLWLHAHALFSYREGDEPRVASGHLKATTVRYTAEIELRPVIGGAIGMRPDPVTGTAFWDFGA